MYFRLHVIVREGVEKEIRIRGKKKMPAGFFITRKRVLEIYAGKYI